MSVALDANSTDDQAIRHPEKKLGETHVDDADYDVRLEKADQRHEEYTALLRKHLGVVETELSRLKGPKSNIAGEENMTNVAIESVANEEDMQTQEARIYRVPPWKWREVKTERAINPKLPILIASSKGHGRVGRRFAGQRSSNLSNTLGDDNTNQKDSPSFDVAYRLAINSRILLNLLGDCTGMDFPEERNVWLRPFKYLVAYETEIRQALQEAEATFKVLEANTEPSLSDQAVTITNHDTVSLSAESVREPGEVNVDAVDALRVKVERDQLRCLVGFMESDMEDIFEVKRQVSNQTLEDVAFEHLWLLYKPGDLVYTMTSVENRGTYQAFRVLHVTGGRPILDTLNKTGFNAVKDRTWEDESDTEERARDTIRSSPSNMTPFIMDCFSVDFDGYRLGPKSRRFVIPTFTGKRRIDALEVCPSFFHPQRENVRQDVIRRGWRFARLVNGAHQRYSGRTLRESRELWDDSYWNYIIHDEEVHSEVIVDQAGAVSHYRKNITRWKFKIGGRVIGVPTEADRREVFDPLPVKRDQDVLSDVLDDSIIDLDRRNDFVNTTTLLNYYRDVIDPSVSDNYVMLLPFRVYGYAMLNRKWFPLNINLISEITPDEVRMTAAGYEDLVLPEGHKKLLQAVVKNQLRDPKQYSTRREEDSDEFQMDVVKGKGRGLIILLHGAPGVGKTSTAECVAAQLKRPLLPITCGDISTKVKEAEETLQEYCALADRWRCVLLLDEADVFLAKREKGDITRNGLVSVFLRVLEYFSGVIILTTNRVGEFDEAFRSRIHVSLYYPKLDRDATSQIWERNLLRLRNSGLQLDFSEDEILRFAEQHWLNNVKNPARHWNGRQIKNAFQTALALANWEFYEMKQGKHLERPQLKAKHFNRVAQTSAHFDDYISDMYNISEDPYSVLAARDGFRKDTHPAMALGRSDTQDFVPRSKKAGPDRRGAGMRNVGNEENRKSNVSGDARVRQLELELELLKLKQASGNEEVQARAGDDDDDDNDDDEDRW